MESDPRPGAAVPATDIATYLRQGAWALGLITVAGYLVDYAFNLSLTRLLTPHDYGDFKVGAAFASFFGLAVLLGGDRAAPLVLAPLVERRQPRRVWEYLRFYLATSFWLGLLLALVTWIASFAHHGGDAAIESHHPLAWVALAVPIFGAGAMTGRVLQAARRPTLSVLPWRIGFPLLELTFVGVAVALRGHVTDLEALGLATAACVVITGLQGVWAWRLELFEVARERDAADPRGWLTASLPLMGSFLVAMALNQDDLYFMEILGDEAEVGHYSAAATLANVVTVVQTTMIGLIAPIARPAIEAGREASRAAFRRSQLAVLAPLIPIALVLFLAGGPLLGLFGPAYRDGHAVLLFLAVGNLAWASAAVASLWAQYRGDAGPILVISIGALVFDSAANWLLIPRYGMNGAAASSALTMTLAALGIFAVLRRGRDGGDGRSPTNDP